MAADSAFSTRLIILKRGRLAREILSLSMKIRFECWIIGGDGAAGAFGTSDSEDCSAFCAGCGTAGAGAGTGVGVLAGSIPGKLS